MAEELVLPGLILLAAMLYSSVGHAGASGYLLAMTLVGVSAGVMKPVALLLNVAVAALTSWRFARAGAVPWRTSWPLVAGAVPMAFVGGSLTLGPERYQQLLAGVLLCAAVRLWRGLPGMTVEAVRTPPVALAALVGAAVGLLSGLTGTGGGIFLSPVLLAFRWATLRTSAGICAVFILANSVAGLLGFASRSSLEVLPTAFPVWMLAAIGGGFVGSRLGSSRLNPSVMRKCLAVVLALASLKLVLASTPVAGGVS